MPFWGFGKVDNENNNTSSGSIANIKSDINTQYETLNKNIDRYRAINNFNKKLSESYLKNLNAMKDVTHLLQEYAELFRLFQEQLVKTNNMVVGNLQADDFSYLENFTRNAVDNFRNDFVIETNKIKELYNDGSHQKEIQNINDAQRSMDSIPNMDGANKPGLMMSRHESIMQTNNSSQYNQPVSDSREYYDASDNTINYDAVTSSGVVEPNSYIYKYKDQDYEIKSSPGNFYYIEYNGKIRKIEDSLMSENGYQVPPV